MTFRQTFTAATLIFSSLVLGCGEDPAEPTGSFADVFLNEFMASNDTIIPNEAGDYVDWVELYNASEVDLSTEGLYITDDLDEPLMHPLPALTIPAGGHLLLWADKEVDLSDYHLPFALEKNGEELGLSYIDDGGEATLLDGVAFGEQVADLSWARMPDGGAWAEDVIPTPGTGN